MRNLAGLIVSILILSGCATTAKQSDLACEGKDWEAFGKATAESGVEVRSIDKYKNGCGNFDKSSLDAYLDGYARGLITFCTYEKGYEHGKNSLPESDVCPYEIKQFYAQGYKVGQREHKENILKIDRLRRESENRLDNRPQNPAKGGSSPENPVDAFDGSL